MKKKFLSIIFAICLIIPAMFMLSACSTTEEDNVQIRVQDGYVQWSSNDSDWKNVITIEEILDSIGNDITGPQGEQGVAGKQVEFNVSDTHIQWRYVGDSTWNDLVALNDIKGEQGNDGDDGKDASVVEYTITYNYNIDFDITEYVENYKFSQTIKSNQWIENMPNINIEEFGYKFNGWYIKDTDILISNFQFIGNNVELEAKYEPIKYNISYNLDEGTIDSSAPIEYTIKSTDISLVNPNKSGYHFLGWYSTEDFDEESKVTNIPSGTIGDINLFAKYDKIFGYSYRPYVNTAIITSIKTTYSTEIEIPKIIDGYTVTEIKGCSGNEEITKLTIPDSVTLIDDNSFSNCINLGTIVTSNSIEYIGKNVLNNTKWLNNQIENGNKLIYLDNYLIKGIDCEGIINIKEGIKCIASEAFIDSALITQINMPNSVEKIGDSAFKNCSSLKIVNISNSINYIDSYAFSNCDNLEYINIDSLKSWLNIDFKTSSSNPLYYGELFLNHKKVNKIIIPEEIREIKDYAFMYSNITSVEFPSTLKSIGKFAFSGCEYLTEVKFNDYSYLNLIDEYAFSSSGLKNLILPFVDEIKERAFSNCASLTSISFETSSYWANIVTINDNVFTNCSALNNINFGIANIHIGSRVFQDCTGLSTIYLTDTTCVTGEYAFIGTKTLAIYSNLACGGTTWGTNWNGTSSTRPDTFTYHTGYTYEQYLAEINATAQ